MRNSVLAAAAAALVFSLPVFSAEGVVNWGSGKGDTKRAYAQQYEEAMKRYYEQQLAARVPSARSQAAFVPPSGVVPHMSAAGDYFSEMVNGNGADRWTAEQMPLRVYIGRGGAGFRDSFPSLFSAAMNEWCTASGSKISWKQVSAPEDANIVVSWSAGSTSTAGEAGDTHTQYGMDSNGQRCLTFAEISLIPTNGAASYTDQEMHKVCLHEIGHALGLRHSSTPGDIMYFQSNMAQVSALGPRDASTIQRLYGKR